MKRILTFLFACFYFLCASAQEKIHYTDFMTDDAPQGIYPSHAALMYGLNGKCSNVTVEAIINNECAVTGNQYLETSAEVCNTMAWNAEMITDGKKVVAGYIRYWWENGFDAEVTLDWAINSGLKNKSIFPYLELKKVKLNRQICRCFKFPDGSVLVMLKVGRESCGNMFLRLLRKEPKPIVKKEIHNEEETVVKLGDEQTKVKLGSTVTSQQPLQLTIKQSSQKDERLYAPVKFQQCCNGGMVLIRGRNTTPSPILVGGGDPGGGGSVGGGNPGGSGTVGGGDPGGN